MLVIIEIIVIIVILALASIISAIVVIIVIVLALVPWSAVAAVVVKLLNRSINLCSKINNLMRVVNILYSSIFFVLFSLAAASETCVCVKDYEEC